MKLHEYLQKIPEYTLTLADIGDPSKRNEVQRFCELACKCVSLPDDRVLCKVLGQLLMFVDGRDEGFAPHMMMNGYWEMWGSQVVARSLKPGMLAIDVGANTGYYTLMMAMGVGSTGSVVAFDPNKRLCQLLRASCALNGFASFASVYEVALSNFNQKRGFAMSSSEPLNSGFVGIPGAKVSDEYAETLTVVDVDTRTLDSYGFAGVGLVKVDVEGAEYEVWEGMKETVKRSPDICVVMETNASRAYALDAMLVDMQRFFPTKYVDYDGQVKPLTTEMVRTKRVGEDWMLYLRAEPKL